MRPTSVKLYITSAPNKNTKLNQRRSGETKRKQGGARVAPTLANIQTKLRKTTNKPKKTAPTVMSSKLFDDAYACCRLDPFNVRGGAMLPDGSLGKRIVVDHRMYFDIVPTATTKFAMKVIPALPAPLIIKSLSTAANSLTVNGVPCSNSSFGATTDLNWFVPDIFPEYSIASTTLPQPTGQFVPPVPLYSATKARIISQGWKIYYTGQALNAAGTITANNSPVAITDTSISTTNSLLIYNGATDANVNGYTPNQILNLDLKTIVQNVSTTQLTNDSVTCRPEGGCVGLLRQSNPVHPFTDYNANPLVLTDENQLISGTNNITFLGLTSSKFNGGLVIWDGAFDPVDIIVTTSGATGISYRVEIVSCVEYLVDPTSSVIKFTADPPKPSHATLELVDQILQREPIMRPLHQEDAPIKQFVSAVSKISGRVAAVPGMAGLIGGGVNVISNLIESML